MLFTYETGGAGGVEQPWQAYRVTVEPMECRQEAATSRRHYGLARFFTPWALDTTQVEIPGGLFWFLFG
jgi:hypothetical protein